MNSLKLSIWYRLVFGVADKRLQKRIIEIAELDYKKVVDMARAAKASILQSNDMRKTTVTVGAVRQTEMPNGSKNRVPIIFVQDFRYAQPSHKTQFHLHKQIASSSNYDNQQKYNEKSKWKSYIWKVSGLRTAVQELWQAKLVQSN